LDNEKKAPSPRPTWFNPSATFKLLLIVAFLCLNAVGNLITAFAQFRVENMYGAMIYLLTSVLYLVPAFGLYRLKKMGSPVTTNFLDFICLTGFDCYAQWSVISRYD